MFLFAAGGCSGVSGVKGPRFSVCCSGLVVSAGLGGLVFGSLPRWRLGVERVGFFQGEVFSFPLSGRGRGSLSCMMAGS